jgi:hypothetical protein
MVGWLMALSQSCSHCAPEKSNGAAHIHFTDQIFVHKATNQYCISHRARRAFADSWIQCISQHLISMACLASFEMCLDSSVHLPETHMMWSCMKTLLRLKNTEAFAPSSTL